MIITGSEKYNEIIKSIDEYLMSFHIPDVFDVRSSQNVIKSIDESFQSLCASLEANGTTGAADLTVFEFFSRIEYYEKKYRDQLRAKK